MAINTSLTADFWDDLLDLIEGGNVIPIVGQGVVTISPDDQLLSGWLAEKLANRLAIPDTALPGNPSLNDVICRHLIGGGDRNVVYTRLFRILRDECPLPGETLCDLASITGLQLFITTTFDPLLTNAINAKRYGGQPATCVRAYSPGSESKDLPARKRDLPGATVFHILGKVSQVGDYVSWEEDMLEFICGLHQHMPIMDYLSRDLKDPNQRFLVLGLSFADWLVRFFLRVVRQTPLSAGAQRIDYLADGPAESIPASLVMFFGNVVRSVQVIPCEPRQFVKELSTRWLARHPLGFHPSVQAVNPPAREMPSGAIFVSYAREDEQAAKQIKSDLESHGCTVWYDRERLLTGHNFHRQLEDEVKQRCGLFLSLISRTTESQSEAYFHLERNWAAERAQRYSDHDRHEFYHPVIVDDTDPGAVSREPRLFSQCQRSVLPMGRVSTAFGQRMFSLQRRHVASTRS